MRIPFTVALTLAFVLPGRLAFAGPFDMDYGPFLTATYLAQWPKENVVLKGIAVKFRAPIEGEAPPEGPVGGGNFTSSKDKELAEVYRTQRTDFNGYKLNVPNGAYKVTLQFCESREAPKTGKRTFDVSLQGKKVIDKLDLIEKAGRDKPLDLTFDVDVANSQLAIDFGGSKSAATLSGLVIEGKDVTRKIKCGGPAIKNEYTADWPASYTFPKNPELAGMLFDTELLRVAAGWSGDFVNLKGVVYDGGHGTNPSTGGVQQIGTRNAPGWARGEDLKDPRSIPHGPLPRDWARYKGLYRHEQGTVFAYTVGGSQVLELPNVEVVEKVRVFSRTLNLKDVSQPLIAVVADLEGAKGQVSNGIATLLTPERVTLARVVGGPAGTALEVVDENRIVLKVPAAANAKIKVCLWGGPTRDWATGVAALAKAEAAIDLAPLTKGGKALWTETVTTEGKRGADTQAYVLDDLTPPFKNPYNSYLRFGGFDVFSDGRIAVSTWSGDVWIVSGINDKLDKLVWKRYATGLFHALGLKIVDDKVYVLGRDQITRLHDLNGDGEADFYECFNNDVMITQNFHEFTFELQTDAEGNFYFVKGGPVRPGGSGWDKLTPHHGCLFKVSKDGSKFEVVARGFRAPNGMGVGPRGELTVGDNEGTWTPMCPLNWVKPNGFYGVPEFSDRMPKPTVRDNPLCWFPKEIDNSNGGQVWITGDKFGPLSGQLLHSSYGTCTLYSVLKDEVGGQMQGGVVPLPLKFDTGICRGRFHPGQNALYLAGLRGWQTRASKDAGLYRVRYTGKAANMPVDLKVRPGEIQITFSDKLDKKSAEDSDSYGVSQWNYRWTSSYGSPHFKVSNPKMQGHDEVEIEDVKLSADGKTVTLKIDKLKPVMQMKIDFKLKAADGTPIKTTLHHTINVVGDLKAELHPGELKIIGEK
ncbi:MAG: malectin [Gemmataceae bacterium]|nr:malectin [Gemmataceae bacterium]